MCFIVLFAASQAHLDDCNSSNLYHMCFVHVITSVMAVGTPITDSNLHCVLDLIVCLSFMLMFGQSAALAVFTAL
jgi:hypothetical protein